jgi:hypothetical protein
VRNDVYGLLAVGLGLALSAAWTAILGFGIYEAVAFFVR